MFDEFDGTDLEYQVRLLRVEPGDFVVLRVPRQIGTLSPEFQQLKTDLDRLLMGRRAHMLVMPIEGWDLAVTSTDGLEQIHRQLGDLIEQRKTAEAGRSRMSDVG